MVFLGWGGQQPLECTFAFHARHCSHEHRKRSDTVWGVDQCTRSVTRVFPSAGLQIQSQLSFSALSSAPRRLQWPSTSVSSDGSTWSPTAHKCLSSSTASWSNRLFESTALYSHTLCSGLFRLKEAGLKSLSPLWAESRRDTPSS